MRVALVVTLAMIVACTQSGGADAGHQSSSSSSGSSSGVIEAPDASPNLDAGHGFDVPIPDAGPPCGDVPVQGVCVSDLLRYCESGHLRESDCAARNRTCGLQTQLGGYWCLGGVGQSCEVIEVDACESNLECVNQVCTGLTDGGSSDGGAVVDGGGSDGSPGPDAG